MDRLHTESSLQSPNALSGRPDWRCAHEELQRLASTRARLDVDEGTWLLHALRAGTHIALGYATFGEYIERLFGYKPRWTDERLRVAEALETLPSRSTSAPRLSRWLHAMLSTSATLAEPTWVK